MKTKITRGKVVLNDIERQHLISYLWNNNLYFSDAFTLKLQETLEVEDTYLIKDNQVIIPYSDCKGSYTFKLSKLKKVLA